jgi:exosortase A
MVELQQVLDTPLPLLRRRAGLWYLAAGAVAFGMAALCLLFHEAVIGAVRVWIDSRTFNHCFLIIPIAGYMIWQRRARFAALTPQPSWWGLALVPPLAMLWLLGHVASVLEAEQVALVAMLQALLLTCLGFRIYRAFLFPFLYLFLLVPSGEYLTAPLQDFTAGFILAGLRLLRIPVYSDGVLISIPNGDFQVAEACAGLRFLIASLAFGLLFAEQMYRSWWRRALFVALSVAVPVVANGCRALGIVLIGHWSDMRYATGVDHILYGWIFFSLVLLGLMWIGMRFREDGHRAEALAVAPVLAPRGAGPALVAASFLVLAIGAAAPAYAAWRESRPPTIDRAAIQPPPPAPGWRLIEGAADAWHPVVEPPDIERFAAYQRGADTVFLALAFYETQRRGAKAVSAIERMADDHSWTRVADSAVPAELDGRRRIVTQTRIRSVSAGNRLVWNWYWIGGRVTASRPLAKLLQAETTLLEGRRSAAVIALATPYNDDVARAARVLQDFVRDMPSIDSLLDRATGG